MSPNRAASIRARLKNHADARGQDYNLILTRYALERLMYRLSVSRHANNFLLKGAMLFAIWFDAPHRPTADVDLLGFGGDKPEDMANVFRDLCAITADDAIEFEAISVQAVESRAAKNYGGVRVTLNATLGGARLRLQVDIGFGDAVTPEAQEITFPSLLDDVPPPRLRVYPRETVFAEKLEAITALGLANTRMKDYFDLLALARESEMDRLSLAQAIAATFARRGTAIPMELPTGLTAEFSADAAKQRQWRGFLAKNRLEAPALSDLVAELADFSRAALAHAVIICGKT